MYAIANGDTKSSRSGGKKRTKNDDSNRPNRGFVCVCDVVIVLSWLLGSSQGDRKRGIGSLSRDEEVRVAAIKGKVDVVTELLENGEHNLGIDCDTLTSLSPPGFNVNTPLKGGWVALMYACNHANSDIVRLLLQHGANPNTHKGKQDKRNKDWSSLPHFLADMFTALMAVGSSKSTREEDLVECAKALIDEGARPNAHDRFTMISCSN